MDQMNPPIINIEDLDEDQIVGDDNAEIDDVEVNDAVILDDEDNQDELTLTEGEELGVFQAMEEELDDEYDDTGFTPDDYEDMSDDSEE